MQEVPRKEPARIAAAKNYKSSSLRLRLKSRKATQNVVMDVAIILVRIQNIEIGKLVCMESRINEREKIQL